MRTRPSGPWVTRSCATAGRRTYLRSASRPCSSRPPARVAACNPRPVIFQARQCAISTSPTSRRCACRCSEARSRPTSSLTAARSSSKTGRSNAPGRRHRLPCHPERLRRTLRRRRRRADRRPLFCVSPEPLRRSAGALYPHPHQARRNFAKYCFTVSQYPLTGSAQHSTKAVAMDMWEPCMNSVGSHLRRHGFTG
jgi:hypothetical protein